MQEAIVAYRSQFRSYDDIHKQVEREVSCKIFHYTNDVINVYDERPVVVVAANKQLTHWLSSRPLSVT